MPDHADRLLRLEGTSNCRDLGGYVGHEGRPLRWRRLFRSDHLGALTAADREQLAAIGLSRVLDFRGAEERAAASYSLPGVELHALTIEPAVSRRLQEHLDRGARIDAALTARLMRELYRGFVNDQSRRYAEFFAHLLDARGPLLFHCTAGKDRTGFAAALALWALGVPRETVRRDYLLSNLHYRLPPMPADESLAEAMAVLWRVQIGFLDAALEAIDRDHGGIEAYLSHRLGLTPAARATLRQSYLQPG